MTDTGESRSPERAPRPGVPAPAGGTRLGVLAFGDSITNGGGELQWGVALQSWALWVARALGVPYTGWAVDGARARDVVERQIPLFARVSAEPPAGYDVGCLYIGVNDVRAPDWDPVAFTAAFEAALRFVREHCARTLVLTAPLRLGLPAAGPKVAELNDAIRTVAERAGRDASASAGRGASAPAGRGASAPVRRDVLVVDLSDFGARNHVMPDRVHPTAFGQLAIAERALAVLAADGLPARVAPASLISWRASRVGRLRGDWSYVYRSAKLHIKATAARLRRR